MRPVVISGIKDIKELRSRMFSELKRTVLATFERYPESRIIRIVEDSIDKEIEKAVKNELQGGKFKRIFKEHIEKLILEVLPTVKITEKDLKESRNNIKWMILEEVEDKTVKRMGKEETKIRDILLKDIQEVFKEMVGEEDGE